MPTPDKEQFVEEIAEKFSKAKGIYFTDYLGLDVEQINALRSQFFNQSVDYKVVKNRLTKISAKEAGYEDADDLLSGPTAIAFANDDPVAPAKIITEFQKENEQLALKGCYFEGQKIGLDRISEIAALPSREELLQKLLNGLQSPMRKFARTLASPMQNLVRMLTQIKEQKES